MDERKEYWRNPIRDITYQSDVIQDVIKYYYNLEELPIPVIYQFKSPLQVHIATNVIHQLIEYLFSEKWREFNSTKKIEFLYILCYSNLHELVGSIQGWCYIDYFNNIISNLMKSEINSLIQGTIFDTNDEKLKWCRDRLALRLTRQFYHRYENKIQKCLDNALQKINLEKLTKEKISDNLELFISITTDWDIGIQYEDKDWSKVLSNELDEITGLCDIPSSWPDDIQWLQQEFNELLQQSNLLSIIEAHFDEIFFNFENNITEIIHNHHSRLLFAEMTRIDYGHIKAKETGYRNKWIHGYFEFPNFSFIPDGYSSKDLGELFFNPKDDDMDQLVGNRVAQTIYEYYVDNEDIEVLEYANQLHENSYVRKEPDSRVSNYDDMKQEICTYIIDDLKSNLRSYISLHDDSNYPSLFKILHLFSWVDIDEFADKFLEKDLEFCVVGNHLGIRSFRIGPYLDYLSKYFHTRDNKLQTMLDMSYKSINSGIYETSEFRNFCLISNLPLYISTDDNGKLHCNDGYAIEFTDGWGLHFVHGIFLPPAKFKAYILQRPTGIQILQERNSEIRAVLIKMFGYKEIIAEFQSDDNLQFNIIDEYQGISDITNRSYSYQLLDFVIGKHTSREFEQECRVIVVECHTTHMKTFIGVPILDETETCIGAIAWTFGLTEEEYRPLIES